MTTDDYGQLPITINSMIIWYEKRLLGPELRLSRFQKRLYYERTSLFVFGCEAAKKKTKKVLLSRTEHTKKAVGNISHMRIFP